MELQEEQPPAIPSLKKRWAGKLAYTLLVLGAAAFGVLGGLFIVYSTDLPQVQELDRYRPSAITELYDSQGRVIGSFAVQRRVIAGYADYPKVLGDAILSIEDKDFNRHWGIDFYRALGAAYHDIRAGSREQGASTLTMQLARNLFLSPERTFRRKFQELMLTIQIERRFTKPQIFTLYANQIYLGHGVYGFEAGSQFYFNKHARDLTLEEAALLAGLPKAPNAYSPLHNLERALRRRNLVLNAMLEDGKITVEEATRAKNMPVRLDVHQPGNSIAPYFVEEIRQYLEKRYGSEEVHQGGLRVYTTLNMDLQRAANQALLDGLAAYERRHGWKGRLKNVLITGEGIEGYTHPQWDEPIFVGSYLPALVTETGSGTAEVTLGRYTAVLSPAEIAWTGRRSPKDLLSVGDVAYVKVQALESDGRARVTLEQDSGIQGALLAVDNASGDILAMVGGRDFHQSKFNRATQALRQVGSSFKPYVYTTAMEAGFQPDDVILDAPVVFTSGNEPYAPRNYDGKFEGNITLRRALAQSRNVPAVKLADKLGMPTIIQTARRFGITSPIPAYLPVALGASEVTLLEHTAAFAVFPNDGVRVSPRLIRKVTDYDGHVLEENFPEVRDVIRAETARTMTSLLEGTVQFGTAARARSLGHALAGKTGTTNDFTDAWFMGFSPSITCGVWVGFDEKKTIGKRETGGVAALPIWMNFMKVALADKRDEEFLPPPVYEPRALAQKVDTADETPGDGEAH